MRAFPQTKSQDLMGGSSGYLVVTSLIYLIGFGLVWVGTWFRVRRTARAVSVDLEHAGA